MDDVELEEKLTRIVAIELDLPETEIVAVRSLRDELNMDSVAAASILFAVEEEFGVSFEKFEVGTIDNISDLRRALVAVRSL